MLNCGYRANVCLCWNLNSFKQKEKPLSHLVSSLNTKWFPNLKEAKNEPTLCWWVEGKCSFFCAMKSRLFLSHSITFSLQGPIPNPVLTLRLQKDSWFFLAILHEFRTGGMVWHFPHWWKQGAVMVVFCGICKPSCWDYKPIRLEYCLFFTVILKKYHVGFLYVRCFVIVLWRGNIYCSRCEFSGSRVCVSCSSYRRRYITFDTMGIWSCLYFSECFEVIYSV